MKMGRKINLLVIEDEEYDARRIRNTIAPFSNKIHIRDVVSSGAAALDLLQRQKTAYHVIIMDFQIQGNLRGERLIKEIKAIDSTLQIIVMTKMTSNLSDFDFANELLEAGAMWYCTKYPGDIEEYIYQPTDFVLSIFNAFEKRRLERDQIRSTSKLQRNAAEILQRKRIIGVSAAAQNLRDQAAHCAEVNANVLVQGNSGTGKEVIATNIHYQSKRNTESFVPVNCGSLPDHLVESELFGYEKGAFTGATTQKKGLFEVANKGTIFLDEIAELPMSAQAKLLRVIQEGEIDKIGRLQRLRVDVRIIAATNRDLSIAVQEKRFREDLFYRLNVVQIKVPELSARADDIPVLLEHFPKEFLQRYEC